MNSYRLMLLVQAVFNFAVVVLFGSLLIREKGRNGKGKIRIRKSLYRTFSPKMTVCIVLADIGLTRLLTFFTDGILSRAVIFITIIAIAPYFITGNRDRIAKERMFADVIVYCSAMGMLLRQTKSVYMSLDTVKKDVGGELAGDIEVLQESLNVGEENTREVMEEMEKKYPYTCISNLNIIMFHMAYESPKMASEMFNTYLDDIAKLDQDVKKNGVRRTTMRVTYFGLTAGGFLMYVYFYSSMSATVLAEMYASTSFRICNLVYVFLVLLALLFVDRYFCLNTFREV